MLTLLAVSLLLISRPVIAGDELPSDATKRIEAFEAEADSIRKKADAEIRAQREKLLEGLQALQESYSKAGKLDEALAIRQRIKEFTAARGREQELVSAAKQRSQNLLINGSFEEGPETPNDGVHNFEPEKGSTDIKGWVVTEMFMSPVDSAYWRPIHGKRSCALAWKAGAARGGGISQDFKTKK
jgi:hypothetical protein